MVVCGQGESGYPASLQSPKKAVRRTSATQTIQIYVYKACRDLAKTTQKHNCFFFCKVLN